MAVKIAIVGGAESRNLAPFEYPEWEIWGCNNVYLGIPRYTRWFEIHKIWFDGQTYYRRGEREFRGVQVKKYMQELADLSIPVYMQKCWPIIPKGVLYPLDKIVGRFGRYLTSSIAYMVALAIREGVTDLALYGINMGMGDEYDKQKPCIEYLLGYAKGMGVRVTVAPESMLLYTPRLYGFEEILLPGEKEISSWMARFQK